MTPAKGYTEMKDSGIEWIPQIPTDWQVKRLKELFSFGKGLPITKADLVDSGVAVISYGQIHAKSNTGTHLAKSLLRYVPKTFLETNPSAILRKGDIVLADTSEDLDGLGNAALMDIDDTVFAGYHTIILHPGNADFSKYLSYLFRTDNWRSQLRANASGIKVFSVTQKMLRSCNLILPPKAVRDAITAYLDTQCAKIDEIIAQAKASIEDYKQWKASIIYEAVTKGLDPNVEMEDSGIDIIGEMPRHWEKCRLKYLCDIMTGNQDTQNADENGEYPFYVRSPIVQRAKDYTYEGEGILMAGDGAGAGRVFHHAVGKYAIHQRVYCFHNFRNISVEYFLYFISELFKRVMDKGSAQSTVPSVRLPMIQDFVFCIPPVEEQTKIVNFLTQKCSKIYELISEKQSLIDDLESYKKSLIYEVVTGKRRVC